eukprot:5315732-Prymnesium_polylepis.1
MKDTRVVPAPALRATCGIPLASYARLAACHGVRPRPRSPWTHPDDATRTTDAPCCSTTNKSMPLFPARVRWVSDGSRQS